MQSCALILLFSLCSQSLSEDVFSHPSFLVGSVLDRTAVGVSRVKYLGFMLRLMTSGFSFSPVAKQHRSYVVLGDLVWNGPEEHSCLVSIEDVFGLVAPADVGESPVQSSTVWGIVLTAAPSPDRQHSHADTVPGLPPVKPAVGGSEVVMTGQLDTVDDPLLQSLQHT